MKMLYYFLSIIITLFVAQDTAMASCSKEAIYNVKDSINIYYKFDQSNIEQYYRTNYTELNRLDALLDEYSYKIDSISIISFASITGESNYNHDLSIRRGITIKNYIDQREKTLPKSLSISIAGGGENWEGLLEQAYERKWIPNRIALIELLKDSTLSNETKKERIKQMRNGEVYDYLNEYVFWRLRNATSVILWYKPMREINLANISAIMPDTIHSSIRYIDYIQNDDNRVVNKPSKPIFAIKTNLLYDVATLTNMAIEIPIGKRLSIASELIFPFWKGSKSDFTLNMLTGNLDIKYWLGNRKSKAVMTGWFCDLQGGYGKYDFQLFSKKGIQGTFLSIGVGAGYAHSIAKNLRLEYALGVGYSRNIYDKYEMVYTAEQGNIKSINYPWEKYHYNWIGPTKASLSLVWLINRKG